MTEKRVSVRIAAVGGEQVRAQLTEVGTQGARAMDNLAQGAGRMGPRIQNAAFQVGDFAVQVAAGTSATRAMAQQLPQLLGGFGVIGAVIGAAAAVMVPFIGRLFETKDAMGEMVDEILSGSGSISSVESAVSAVERVQREYIDTIKDTGGASSAAASAVVANSQREFAARKEVLAIEVELLRIRGEEQRERLNNLTTQIDLQRRAAEEAGRNLSVSGIDPAMDAAVRFGAIRRPRTEADFQLENFLEQNREALLAARKLRAEMVLTDQALTRTGEMMKKEFADIASGTSGDDGKKGGGGADAATEMAREAKRVFEDTRTAAERYADEVERLNALYRAGEIDADTYSRAMEKVTARYEEQARFAQDVGNKVRGTLSGIFRSIGDGSENAIDSLRNLGRELAAMVLEQQMFAFLAKLAPNIFGAKGSIPLVKSANGNAFDGGRVIPFASGGVVTRATVFPLRGATGLMGEAGPEAILPLTRIGGRLGVASAGGGGTVVQVIDQRRGGAAVTTEKSRGPDGREMVRVLVADEMAKGAFDRSMSGRYGAKPQAVRR